VAIVGDVTVEQVRRLAEKYWGSWTAAPGAVTLARDPAALAAEPLPKPQVSQYHATVQKIAKLPIKSRIISSFIKPV